VDSSLRALLARIERLEQALARAADAAAGGTGTARAQAPEEPPATASAPEEPPATAPVPQESLATAPPRAEPKPSQPPEPAQVASAGGVATAAAAVQPDELASGGPDRARGLEGVTALWPAVVDLVRGEHGLLGAIIAKARPAAVRGDDLTLAFAAEDQFPKKKAEDASNRMIVGEALRAVTGTSWRLSYELREAEPGEAPDAAPQTEEEWVRRFMEEFDAEDVEGDWSSQPAAEQQPMSSGERGA
jgi:DNA polymerase-3 subunit gamma/tau